MFRTDIPLHYDSAGCIMPHVPNVKEANNIFRKIPEPTFQLLTVSPNPTSNRVTFASNSGQYPQLGSARIQHKGRNEGGAMDVFALRAVAVDM